MQYAQCPHCLSSLQMTAQQLKQKEGLVRCGHCDEVFNALSPPQPKHLANSHTEQDALNDEELAPWESKAQAATNKKPPYRLIVLILGLILIGQVGHQNSTSISQNIHLQPYIKQLNKALGLQIPLYRELNQIRIIERQLSDHPHSTQALLLRLSIKNAALIEQAYPQIRLLLSSDKGDKVAHISFNPRDYLEQKSIGLFPAQSNQDIELSFDKPDTNAAGFEISFSH